MNRSVLLSMGTRPEIIKMAPVYQALKNSSLPVTVLHTGQHEEMAWPLYEFFDMQPDHQATLDRTSGSLADLSALLLQEIYRILQQAEPAAVLVHGDTCSALAAALAAFYLKIPVGHVEAGLRSGMMYDPFPEEKNRELIGRIASWHFVPTSTAEASLLHEGLAHENIYRVGNTIVDASLWGMQHLERLPEHGRSILPASLAHLPAMLPGKRLIMVTAHRRENWETGIASIAAAVGDALQTDADICVVWPVHANPHVQSTVRQIFASLSDASAARLFLCEPLNYPVLLWVMKRAWLVLTDSGGIQEEAMVIGVPVFVLRDTTERPELIEAGGGILVGTDTKNICEKLRWLHADDTARKRMCGSDNPFGDGHAAEYIRDILSDSLNSNQPKTDFADSPSMHQTRFAKVA